MHPSGGKTQSPTGCKRLARVHHDRIPYRLSRSISRSIFRISATRVLTQDTPSGVLYGDNVIYDWLFCNQVGIVWLYSFLIINHLTRWSLQHANMRIDTASVKLGKCLVVVGKPRRYGMASAEIPVFSSQKPSAENRSFRVCGSEIALAILSRLCRSMLKS